MNNIMLISLVNFLYVVSEIARLYRASDLSIKN